MHRSVPWFTRAPCEKQLPAPHRSSDRRTTLAGRVVGNHLLVPLELAPGDIAIVLILEQHVPFGHWAPQAALDALAAILNADLAHRAPKSIGAGIDRVGQDIVHGVVERQSPNNTVPLRRAMTCNGQCNALVAQPHVHLSQLCSSANLAKTSLRASCTRWFGSKFAELDRKSTRLNSSHDQIS